MRKGEETGGSGVWWLVLGNASCSASAKLVPSFAAVGSMNRPQNVLPPPSHEVPWWLEKLMVATVGKSRRQAPKLMFFYQAKWQDPGPESGPPAILVGKYGVD